MKKILVIGSGAWGSAIANLVAGNGNQVFLSAVDLQLIQEVNQKHTNSRFLPGISLSKNIMAISGLKTDVDFVFIVVPSTVIKDVFKEIAAAKFNKNCIFVICSKGIESSSLMLLTDAFEKIVKSKNYAALSGPNFAIEVASKLPTVTTIASANKALANKVIALVNNDYFRGHYFKDPRSAEIFGVVKNIIAIACGIAEGLELGVNAKAATVMKGISEIQLLCKALKASPDVVNAAGFGDIFLTCSSSKSRNNSLGKLIATGGKMEKGKTYEGASSAELIVAIAKKLKLKLDLCEAVSEILSKKLSQKEIKQKIVKAILK
jgi:glycerol-3-phosphate dehydrogenase (NAD(P)+)